MSFECAFFTRHIALRPDQPFRSRHIANAALPLQAGYHSFLNGVHRLVRAAGRQSLVWEGFDPDPSRLGQQHRIERVDDDVIVMPFDAGHHDGWDRTPIDYFVAGYRIVNAAWAPLYVCGGGGQTSVDDIALWDPTLFGGPVAADEAWTLGALGALSANTASA